MSFFGIPMRNGLSLGLGTVASLTNGPGFLPDELFYGGTVQGAWYDPSDLSTLFQDSAGTTPVTAVEQAVGLMLDKSKGLVLGPELVTNGDFSSGTGWSLGAGWSISGGVLNGATGAFSVTSQSGAYVTGRTYRVELDMTRSAGYVNVYINSGTGYIAQTTAKHVFYLVAGSSGTLLSLGGATFTGTIDNISVKELPGNHAYQSINTSRPTLRARYNLLTYSEEFENAYWTKSNSSVVNTTATTDPLGGTTAELLYPLTAGNDRRVIRLNIPSSAVNYTASAYIKAAGKSWAYMLVPQGLSINDVVWFDLINGVVGTVGSSASSASIQSVGNGWYRCTVTGLGGSPSSFFAINVADANGSVSVTPSGTDGIYIWGAQLVPTAVFPSNTYQRVGAATDYATGAAFPPYLAFDGTDDSMLTNSVDFATVTSDGQARRNLLLNPTQFDASAWGSVGTTVTANAAISPSGLTDAEKLVEDGSTGLHTIGQNPTISSGATYTFSVYVKAAERTWAVVQLFSAIWAYVNLSNGTVGNTSGSPTVSVADAGNGWYRVSVTAAVVYPTASCVVYVASANGTVSYAGTPGSGIFVYGGQLETGSTATAFQNIGTDKMLVVAGVTKNSDANEAIIVELSANASSNAGAFNIFAPGGLSVSRDSAYVAVVGGTTRVAYGMSAATYPAPITNVVNSIANIGAPSAIFRVNGTQAASSSSSQGTGNFGNYPLYIGRRFNSVAPFNGNLYSLIIAGQSYSSGQISSTESWVAAKTPLGTI